MLCIYNPQLHKQVIWDIYQTSAVMLCCQNINEPRADKIPVLIAALSKHDVTLVLDNLT